MVIHNRFLVRKGWTISAALMFVAAADCAYILSGCTSGRSLETGGALPDSWLVAALIFALGASSCYATAVIRENIHVANIASLLASILLSSLLLISLYVGATHQSICPLCWIFWGAVISAVACDSVRAVSLRFFVVIILLAAALIPQTVKSGFPNGALRRTMVLDTLRNFGVVPPTRVGPLHLGQELPAELTNVNGALLVATKCGQCTEHHSQAALQLAGVTARDLTILVPDNGVEWKIPPGYGSAKRIVSQKAWESLKVPTSGPTSNCANRGFTS